MVVKNVNLAVQRGTIHALIGPNGAGKTTCFNLLTKFLAPTTGRIFFDGTDITGRKPHDISHMGLVRSFQISAVFPRLSVRENVRIALQQATGQSFRFWQHTSRLDHLNARVDELLDEVDLRPFAPLPAMQLPYGRKRALEIATTIALEPKMLLLDEPMAGMNVEEKQDMCRFILDVNDQFGTTIVLIEHDMGVVMDISDRVVVLDYGKKIGDGEPEEVKSNPEVIAAYLGTQH
jgi:branched-chain amino acid transport system ATP-binding protein